MRIVFMGTPEFAVPSLQAIVDAGFSVMAVATQPDRPRGRGMRLMPPPIKQRALELDLLVLQPEKVRGAGFLDQLTDLAPDCIVVVAFGQLIPDSILNLPRFGCINVHPSLLPTYRGATPMQQALLDGLTETGVTTMYLDSGMDTGDIILQTHVAIEPSANIGQLHNQLAGVGAELLVETLRQVEAGTAPRIPQNHAAATLTQRLKNTDGEIDWNAKCHDITNLVRAFTPWPGAYTFRSGERVKLLRVAPGTAQISTAVPGTIIGVDQNSFHVACGDGAVEIFELQPENGSRMSAADYARGRHLEFGANFSSGQLKE